MEDNSQGKFHAQDLHTPAPNPPSVEENEKKEKSKKELRLRVFYAFLMMGGSMIAAIEGGILWAILAFFVMGGIGFEWSRMAGKTQRYVLISSIISAFSGFGFVIGSEEVKVIAFGAFVIVLAIATIESGIVGILGSTYLALCGFSLASLRAQPEFGLLYIFGLFSVCWATDSSAFAVGKIFKGPKLWPQISPNKTWSGSIGGTIAGTLAGGLYSFLANFALKNPDYGAMLSSWLLAGFVLAIFCQAGDLLESMAKRHFGVKDTSTLIPGHGGLLDRIDGHLAAAFALSALLLIPKLAENLH